jgi:hypothetical protein
MRLAPFWLIHRIRIPLGPPLLTLTPLLPSAEIVPSFPGFSALSVIPTTDDRTLKMWIEAYFGS